MRFWSSYHSTIAKHFLDQSKRLYALRANKKQATIGGYLL